MRDLGHPYAHNDCLSVVRRSCGVLDRQKHNRRQRLIVCTVVIIILLAGFAGLRTRCNDTVTYRYYYKLLTEKNYGKHPTRASVLTPLYNWVNYRLKMHGVSTQNFLIFWAFLTVGCYLIFAHKYSVNFPCRFFAVHHRLLYLCFLVSNRRRRSGYRSLRRCLHLKKKWLLFAVGILIATLDPSLFPDVFGGAVHDI